MQGTRSCSLGRCAPLGDALPWGMSSLGGYDPLALGDVLIVLPWGCAPLGDVLPWGMCSLGGCDPLGDVIPWGMCSLGDVLPWEMCLHGECAPQLPAIRSYWIETSWRCNLTLFASSTKCIDIQNAFNSQNFFFTELTLFPFVPNLIGYMFHIKWPNGSLLSILRKFNSFSQRIFMVYHHFCA